MLGVGRGAAIEGQADVATWRNWLLGNKATSSDKQGGSLKCSICDSTSFSGQGGSLKCSICDSTSFPEVRANCSGPNGTPDGQSERDRATFFENLGKDVHQFGDVVIGGDCNAHISAN